jgi:hypothetical protein
LTPSAHQSRVAGLNRHPMTLGAWELDAELAARTAWRP